jgi:hypothetical protein
LSNSNEKLLQAFRGLWKNRPLETTSDAMTTIRQAILTDLKDELSHPRARSTPHKKFYLAIKRIVHSELLDEDKLEIIKHYEKVLSELE